GGALLLAEGECIFERFFLRRALGSISSLPLQGRDRGRGSITDPQNDPHPFPPLKGEGAMEPKAHRLLGGSFPSVGRLNALCLPHFSKATGAAHGRDPWAGGEPLRLGWLWRVARGSGPREVLVG